MEIRFGGSPFKGASWYGHINLYKSNFVNPFSPLCHTCLVQNQLKKNTDCYLMCDRLYLYEIIKVMLDRFFTLPYFNVVFYSS